MPQHRPRASDFDETDPKPIHQSSSTDHKRRPSPTYDPPPQHHQNYHSDQHQKYPQRQRLTPEESLDKFRNKDDFIRLDQSHPVRYSYPNGYRQGGRDDFFEKRKIDRENAVVDFWPKSPDRPYGEEKKRRHTGHKDERYEKSQDKKSKHRHDKSDLKSKKYIPSDESESDRSTRRRNEKSRRKHKSRKNRKSRHQDNEDEHSNSDNNNNNDKKNINGREQLQDQAKNSSPIEEDVWIETKPVTTIDIAVENPKTDGLSSSLRPTIVEEMESMDEEAIGEVGPMPYNHVTGKAMDPKEFGRALRPGEGSAMAAFIEAGERIPRRGEIGLTGHEIEKFENVGYVMSGSRHRRMNAVRIRKENQVISAEEKRGILKMQAEEKAKREGQIISSFRELVDTKLQENV